MVKSIVSGRSVPDGAISLICGGAGDLLDHLDSQDVVTFTGSAHTASSYACYPNLVAKSIPSPWRPIR
jgi:oxepin-CoA hydrolase/3-oxo-5,6-dehydrosuberyl-CoA semialdehyde dehydrogenase